MSSFCNYASQNCFDNCCDSTGYCPNFSSDCYYYYSNSTTTYSTATLPVGAIIGIVMGSIFFFVFIAVCVCIVKRRAAAMAALNASQLAVTSMNSTVVLPNSGYAQPMYPYPNGMGAPAYNPGYAQPIYPSQGYGAQPYPNQYAQPQVVYNPNPIGQAI